MSAIIVLAPATAGATPKRRIPMRSLMIAATVLIAIAISTSEAQAWGEGYSIPGYGNFNYNHAARIYGPANGYGQYRYRPYRWTSPALRARYYNAGGYGYSTGYDSDLMDMLIIDRFLDGSRHHHH